VVGEADGVLVLGEADAVQRRAAWTVPTGGGNDSAKEASSIRDGGCRRWWIYMNCLPEQHSLVPQTRILAGFQPRRRGKTGWRRAKTGSGVQQPQNIQIHKSKNMLAKTGSGFRPPTGLVVEELNVMSQVLGSKHRHAANFLVLFAGQ